jgi:hypothetical protein
VEFFLNDVLKELTVVTTFRHDLSGFFPELGIPAILKVLKFGPFFADEGKKDRTGR